MIYIYNNNLRYLIGLNYDYEEFIKNPSKYYPSWESSFYATQKKYEYPILDNSVIREKTREERILIDKNVDLLVDSEYIENGEIITVPVPKGFIKEVWDKELHIWKEGATKEELIKIRAEKILKYSEFEENKKALETSKFSSIDEIALVTSELSELEIEINNLAEKIKNM